MMLFILCIVAYVAIGVCVLMWSVFSDPWGGLLLEVWWLVVFFYPLLIIFSMYQKFKK